jgi:T5SS/PEP-CTERM-associated repeat protein
VEWDGSQSDDWFTGGNWVGGTVPDAVNNVRIDSVNPNLTVIDADNAFSRVIDIGASEEGILTIRNGGTLSTGGNDFIGRFLDSKGTVTVTGAGSLWDIDGELVVGQSGMGELTIADGGEVVVGDDVIVAQAANSEGTLNIGAGASGPAVDEKGKGTVEKLLERAGTRPEKGGTTTLGLSRPHARVPASWPQPWQIDPRGRVCGSSSGASRLSMPLAGRASRAASLGHPLEPQECQLGDLLAGYLGSEAAVGLLLGSRLASTSLSRSDDFPGPGFGRSRAASSSCPPPICAEGVAVQRGNQVDVLLKRAKLRRCTASQLERNCLCHRHASGSRETTSMTDHAPIQAPKNVRHFKEPTLVPRQEAVRFLWGDEDSHFVADLVYGRGDRLAGLIFKLAPGEQFRSSKTWRPLYNQDRYYYVVQGELTIQDPETGDVAVARTGEAVYWRGSRYHFGYNFGTDEVFVLDWYAPQDRAATVPEIESSLKKREPQPYQPGRTDLLGRWPTHALVDLQDRYEQGRMVKLSKEHALHFIHGESNPVLMNLYASTEALTAGTFELRPSVMAEVEQHRGDEVLFALEGCLHVYLPETYDWFELHPLDCLYLPEGTPHRYCNNGATMAKAAFCVAPLYR